MVPFLRTAVVMLLLLAADANAAPKAERWARWERHDPASTATIDHTPWAAFLSRYVQTDSRGVNRVEYGSVEADGRRVLAAYIADLVATPISRYARPEQMAYWINLYNALTVDLIVAHYPVKSIREIRISPGLFSSGPWGKKLVRVEEEPISLDDIEHRILRPIWHDARVHYALNCGAVGCPNLRKKPYTGATLDHDLDRAAMAFVNHPRAVRIERGRLYVSSIYVWFEDDFGGNDLSVIRHLMAYAHPELAMQLQELETIAGHDYDWSLNDPAPAAP